MTVWYKQGVYGDLASPMQKALTKIHAIYRAKDEDLFVTAKRDGNHSAGSLHYNGCAVDFRYPKGFFPIDSIKASLGHSFDVVAEDSHIHVEYDPK